jgi:hypothetical protein
MLEILVQYQFSSVVSVSNVTSSLQCFQLEQSAVTVKTPKHALSFARHCNYRNTKCREIHSPKKNMRPRKGMNSIYEAKIGDSGVGGNN